jgi:hypothetical protein
MLNRNSDQFDHSTQTIIGGMKAINQVSGISILRELNFARISRNLTSVPRDTPADRSLSHPENASTCTNAFTLVRGVA